METTQHTEKLDDAVGEPKIEESLKRKREEDEIDASKRVRIEDDVTEAPATTSYTKKKKEYVPKSTFVADDEFEDILVTGWFYLDAHNQQQGPFTTRDMKEWYIAGFFTDDMLVTRVHLGEWKTVADCAEFKNLERRPTDQAFLNMYSGMDYMHQADDQPNPYYSYGTSAPIYDTDHGLARPPSQFTQTAFVDPKTGRVATTGADLFWSSKGLATDKDGRMLNQYLDMDAYQEKMREAKQNPKKKKITKSMVKAFKKKKEDKQRRRILMIPS